MRPRILELAEPEARETESSWPAFCPLDEEPEIFGTQGDTHLTDNQLGRLGLREDELRAADFGNGADSSKPTQANDWIGACGRDDATGGRHVFDRVCERVRGCVAREVMKVVDHDHELAGERRDSIHELV